MSLTRLHFMKNILIAILLLVALSVVGCKPKVDKQPYIAPTIVTDINGKKYRFVSPAMVNSNGVKMVELWERIDPLDTNRWYTPDLASEIYTNNPKSFIPLMR